MLTVPPDALDAAAQVLEELTAGVNSLLVLSAIGVGIYVLTVVLERTVRAPSAKRIVSGVGMSLGALYALFAVSYVVSTQSPSLSLLLMLLVVLVFALAWQAVRDVFAGFICRAGGLVREGDHLAIEGTAGVVRSVGLRSFSIQSGTSDEVVVPYARLMGASVHRSRSEEGGRAITLTVRYASTLSPRQATSAVERAVLLNHWISIRHSPEIAVVGTGELAVTVHLIDPGREVELMQAMTAALSKVSESLHDADVG